MLYRLIYYYSSMPFENKIIMFLTFTFAVIVALTIHEFSHAFMASRLGDDTARLNGRMTLNPMAHFDPMGLASFILFGFGWAKPVPINPYNFKKIKRDTFLVSIAGVASNFILFFVFYPLSVLVFRAYLSSESILGLIFSYLFIYIYQVNLVLMVFNLLPIYPLDGFNALASQLRYDNKYVTFMQRYGVFVLIAVALIFSFTNAFEYLVDYVSYPVKLFWGLFF